MPRPFTVERVPLLYNTSAYDGMESLRLMDGIVDIYMPDFKCWDPEASFRYLRAREYPEVARAAIREMHRQVGDLVLDERGLARRGLQVRHPVMPGGLAGTPEMARFLAGETSLHTYVNVMDQYRPAGRVSGEDFEEIARPISHGEYTDAVRAVLGAGLHRLDHLPDGPAYLRARPGRSGAGDGSSTRTSTSGRRRWGALWRSGCRGRSSWQGRGARGSSPLPSTASCRISTA
jgi:putative pyruvate formate lyase activating enzyme